LTYQAAALTEPLANVVTDVVLPGTVMAGDVVAVAGLGPIGIMAALVAIQAGASAVIIFGVNDDEELRLHLCRSLPAIDHVVNVQKEDLGALVRDVTAGRGVDLFIEAAGAPAALHTGASIIRKLGTVTAIGLTGKQAVEFPYDAFMMKSVRSLFNASTGHMEINMIKNVHRLMITLSSLVLKLRTDSNILAQKNTYKDRSLDVEKGLMICCGE
jgi:threonine dehydrogenase-like Zn-dependent dehydrogenase